MYKIGFLIILLFQACAVKDQEMYAESSLKMKQKSSEEHAYIVKDYIAPVANVVGATVYGAIDGTVETVSYVAKHPELVQQGIQTYQEVEYEHQKNNSYPLTTNKTSTVNGSTNTNIAHSNTPNNKKTYTCYRSYSDVEASSLDLGRPVAEIQYDHCLLSQYTHKTECTAEDAIYVYRINNVPSPCDDKHEFNNISDVFKMMKNIHKSTYWKANYYTNERLTVY